MAQICVDLTVAATVVRSPSMQGTIAEIAAAASGLLGSPDEAWTPQPVALLSVRIVGEAWGFRRRRLPRRSCLCH